MRKLLILFLLTSLWMSAINREYNIESYLTHFTPFETRNLKAAPIILYNNYYVWQMYQSSNFDKDW